MKGLSELVKEVPDLVKKEPGVEPQELIASQVMIRKESEEEEHWSRKGCPKQTIIWSETEDKQLFELYKKRGAVWSMIAKDFPGRTENQVKNRFYSTLRRVATKKIAENNLPPRSSIHMSKEELLQYVEDAMEYGHSCFSKRGRKKKKAKSFSDTPKSRPKSPEPESVKEPVNEPAPVQPPAPPMCQPEVRCGPAFVVPPPLPAQMPPFQAPVRAPMGPYQMVHGPPRGYPPVQPIFPSSIPTYPPRYPMPGSMISPAPLPNVYYNPQITQQCMQFTAQNPPTVSLQARLEEIVMMQQSLIGMLLRQNAAPPTQPTERSMRLPKKQ